MDLSLINILEGTLGAAAFAVGIMMFRTVSKASKTFAGNIKSFDRSVNGKLTFKGDFDLADASLLVMNILLQTLRHLTVVCLIITALFLMLGYQAPSAALIAYASIIFVVGSISFLSWWYFVNKTFDFCMAVEQARIEQKVTSHAH